MCRIFSKTTLPFDFIKPNVIQKLAYKVKYISEMVVGSYFLEIRKYDFLN